MKKKYIFFIFVFFFSFHITAQVTDDLLDVDFDSIFDESSANQDSAVSESDAGVSPVNVNRRGIIFGASYEFQGGLAPGWTLAPWHFDGTEEYSWGQGVKMVSNLSINAQLSEVFKVYTSLGYRIPGNIPDFSFSLGDFFFDYNFLNTVFLRAGKYEHTWGISSFTNLLARVPDLGPSGPSYIIKTDIPVGIGGFQALALTRVNIAGGIFPNQWSDLAFGVKYNIALRWVDFNIGVFYQRYVMPTRGFLSLKTTLGKTELYSEWLVAVNTHTDNAVSFAANLGFGRDFFGDKVTLGGEVFYNGEGNTYFFKPETSFTEAETVQFLNQFNIAFNFIYRINGRGSPRIFSSVNFSTAENSYQLVPGFKFTPFSDIEVYFAVPMALGDKDGYYYRHNADPYNRPFSIMMLVTFTGSVYASSF
ncbi:MAG: hypothetical protein LBV17_08265 [Treponema sp.]|nr:hypothetical protein [Treponema sp.]